MFRKLSAGFREASGSVAVCRGCGWEAVERCFALLMVSSRARAIMHRPSLSNRDAVTPAWKPSPILGASKNANLMDGGPAS